MFDPKEIVLYFASFVLGIVTGWVLSMSEIPKVYKMDNGMYMEYHGSMYEIIKLDRFIDSMTVR